MPLSSYDEILRKELQDPEVAAEYLSDALEGGSMEQFLLALRNVAEARGGVSAVAEAADLNRQGMYKILSEQGNPTLSSLWKILHAVGLDIAFRPIGSQPA